MSDRHDDKLATGRTPRPADSVASTLEDTRILSLRRSSSGTRSAGTSTISHVGGVASGCGTWAGSALSTHRRPVTHAAPFPPVTGIGSTFSSTARRRSLQSRRSSLGRSLMSTSQAGSSRPSSTCRETTSPRSCATLRAELAERVDVRMLSWKGAPVPLFKPSQKDVREMLEGLARHTKIVAHADGCTGFTHCHHEKTIVIDGKVAFVGGIDLTLDGGDPWDTPNHVARGGIGWHDAAMRIEGPAVATSRSTSVCAGMGRRASSFRVRPCRTRPATWRLRS